MYVITIPQRHGETDRRLAVAIPRSAYCVASRGKNCFLADRTNGRAYATVLRLSVCLSSVCQ